MRERKSEKKKFWRMKERGTKKQIVHRKQCATAATNTHHPPPLYRVPLPLVRIFFFFLIFENLFFFLYLFDLGFFFFLG